MTSSELSPNPWNITFFLSRRPIDAESRWFVGKSISRLSENNSNNLFQAAVCRESENIWSFQRLYMRGFVRHYKLHEDALMGFGKCWQFFFFHCFLSFQVTNWMSEDIIWIKRASFFIYTFCLPYISSNVPQNVRPTQVGSPNRHQEKETFPCPWTFLAKSAEIAFHWWWWLFTHITFCQTTTYDFIVLIHRPLVAEMTVFIAPYLPSEFTLPALFFLVSCHSHFSCCPKLDKGLLQSALAFRAVSWQCRSFKKRKSQQGLRKWEDGDSPDQILDCLLWKNRKKSRVYVGKQSSVWSQGR